MRVLVAPDKLKGSATAVEAASAMAQGVVRAGGHATTLPLADGGEGTLEAIHAALHGQRREVEVADARARPTTARLLLLDAGRSVVIESADAVGLAKHAGERRLFEGTSYGVGELILHALDVGAARILVALGGSATNDGGIGAAQALGVELVGAPRPARARDLKSVVAIDTSRLDPRLAHVELVALCDVRSPLTGPDGASRMFGPQKGASAEEALVLDAELARLAALARFDASTEGAGAAGGLGFALAALAGARLARGADWVLDCVGFEAALAHVDLVLTAEGSVDAQTLAGKLVARVGERAARAGVPAIALGGRVTAPAESLAAHGIAAAFALADGPMDARESMARAPELLAAAAERVVRSLSAIARGRAP